MYRGTKITIGDEEFIVPPISLGQLRNGMLARLKEHDQLVNDGKLFETVELRGQIILEALRRNYPDFPEEKLLSFLDMGNTAPIWLSILGASGLNQGEAQAVRAIGTSGPSTEASPQPTGGPTPKSTNIQ
jgi:hypothetical protein